MKAIIDNKIEKLAEISTVNATQKIKEREREQRKIVRSQIA